MNSLIRTTLRVALARSAAMIVAAGMVAGGGSALAQAKADTKAPAPASAQTAVFAGGCFWGVDAVFKHVKGVSEVVSGYAGGKAETAHYEQVGMGNTGHAEAVRVALQSSAG